MTGGPAHPKLHGRGINLYSRNTVFCVMSYKRLLIILSQILPAGLDLNMCQNGRVCLVKKKESQFRPDG
jgi:hypothetical protein